MPCSPEDPFIVRSVNSNRQTRSAWERCSAHRHRIHALISSAHPEPGGRLAVLGAGNCNDVDLRALTREFAEIHLVDIDREAIEAAIARQQPFSAGCIVVNAPFDVTGVLAAFARATPCRDGELTDLLTRISTHSLPLEFPYDVVLSAGLLTQLFQSVEDLGFPQPTAVQLVLAVRRRHLAALFELVRPGGAFVLATDVVSTATAPDLRVCAGENLSGRLARLIEDRNFFTGANPSAIWKELTETPEFTRRTEAIVSHDPWLWPVSSAHDYLTWAVTVRTRTDITA